MLDLSLYLVTDSTLSQRPLTEVVAAAVRGGCTMVQLREKHLETDAFIARARIIKEVLNAECRMHNAQCRVPLIINDRVDVALAAGADGVHLGQSDMSAVEARRLLGEKAIIGLSIEHLDEVEMANTLPVDYVAVSPVFSTPTKTDTSQALGLEGARAIVAASKHPVVGIGGMNRRTAAAAMATGLKGIAVVSDIMTADDPEQVAHELATLMHNAQCTMNNEQCRMHNEQCTMKTYKRVLTIAGSDSGGGAGVQADIKTISACGCYAASAITAVTVQNTQGVVAVEPISIATIEGQIRAVIDDIGVDAIKIGMLHSEEVVHVVAQLLKHYDIKNVVLDPVMVSTSGHRLIEESAIDALKRELIPLARVITPNIPEAEILLGHSLPCQEDLPQAARQMGQQFQVSVLMKAGHLTEEKLVDILYDVEQDQLYEFPSVRQHTSNTHGTGCTMSSALASFLAKGHSLSQAVALAKQYMDNAIREGAQYKIGHGFGPVAHFYSFWK